MAEVLSPEHAQPAEASIDRIDTMASNPSSPTIENTPRAQPRSRQSTSSRSTHRLSTLSRYTKSSSRTPSTAAFPAYPSSLAYAQVRDFAYPAFHQMHYGPLPESASGTTTPGSEWGSARRLSDPMDAFNASRGGAFGAGPWGGDGVMYSDPAGDDGEALPATSFGEDAQEDGQGGFSSTRQAKHRKSRSYTDVSDLERGRRHDGGPGGAQRRSRISGDGDSFTHSASKLDPAGQDSLRQSRSYGRKDPHLSATLPSRSFHTGQLPEPDADEDLLPLDAEQSAHAQSPQRASMGPEDELYAGESLALYSFEPENPNELRLREGQIILVSYRHGQGWLVAEDPETGEQGLVPEEYVRLVREIESWDPERGGFIDEDGMLLDENGEPAQARGAGHQSVPEDDPDEGDHETPQTEVDMSLTLDDQQSEHNDVKMLDTEKHDVLDSRPDSAHGQS